MSDKGSLGPDGQLHAACRRRSSGGRHPLPLREKFAIWLSSVGFANDMQAVVYDRNGANYCGRLWWMLKWAGHDAVAVLDGGLQAWQGSRRLEEQRSGTEARPLPDQLRPWASPLRQLVVTDEVARKLGQWGRPWSMHARRPGATRARWNPWTRWQATSPGP